MNILDSLGFQIQLDPKARKMRFKNGKGHFVGEPFDEVEPIVACQDDGNVFVGIFIAKSDDKYFFLDDKFSLQSELYTSKPVFPEITNANKEYFAVIENGHGQGIFSTQQYTVLPCQKLPEFVLTSNGKVAIDGAELTVSTFCKMVAAENVKRENAINTDTTHKKKSSAIKSPKLKLPKLKLPKLPPLPRWLKRTIVIVSAIGVISAFGISKLIDYISGAATKSNNPTTQASANINTKKDPRQIVEESMQMYATGEHKNFNDFDQQVQKNFPNGVNSIKDKINFVKFFFDYLEKDKQLVAALNAEIKAEIEQEMITYADELAEHERIIKEHAARIKAMNLPECEIPDAVMLSLWEQPINGREITYDMAAKFIYAKPGLSVTMDGNGVCSNFADYCKDVLNEYGMRAKVVSVFAFKDDMNSLDSDFRSDIQTRITERDTSRGSSEVVPERWDEPESESNTYAHAIIMLEEPIEKVNALTGKTDKYNYIYIDPTNPSAGVDLLNEETIKVLGATFKWYIEPSIDFDNLKYRTYWERLAERYSNRNRGILPTNFDDVSKALGKEKQNAANEKIRGIIAEMTNADDYFEGPVEKKLP